ncbi:MAG TPA: PaaX family transcriptional regulator C-terminal domain-containing protein [Gemmatimonadaceae bacterium]|nr:PaaX family transcriptional regulator C-terminal domain-containing protein [Gemmatimonadaceae bacterium]
MSTISQVPISYFVYSSLSCFSQRLGGALPGMWFMRAIQQAGRAPAAIRQTLYRMEAEDEIVARKMGRVKWYSASRYAQAEIDAGLARILRPSRRTWSGRWTIVHLRFGGGAAHRVARERVVALLAVEGFALLGADSYISTSDAGPRVVNALPGTVLPHVTVLAGTLLNTAPQKSLLALWNVPRLGLRYRAALDRLRAIETTVQKGISDSDAFLLRFAVVFDYLQVAWDDPDLPRELLPIDWLGHSARLLTARLYRRLLPSATRHAIRLCSEVATFRSTALPRVTT